MQNKYKNKCLNCGYKWKSKTDYTECPKCGETFYLKVEKIK